MCPRAAHAGCATSPRRTPVVPTTTRTPEQFNRIDLPGGPWPYAITSNGGAILVDGQADMSWRRGIDATVRSASASLDEVTTELRRRISTEWVSKFRIAEDLFCYLVVDVDAQPRDFMSEWSAWCIDHGWNASQQGRKVYSMPDPVCKSRAVAEVHRRLTDAGLLAPGSPVFAAGDGALDARCLRPPTQLSARDTANSSPSTGSIRRSPSRNTQHRGR